MNPDTFRAPPADNWVAYAARASAPPADQVSPRLRALHDYLLQGGVLGTATSSHRPFYFVRHGEVDDFQDLEALLEFDRLARAPGSGVRVEPGSGTWSVGPHRGHEAIYFVPPTPPPARRFRVGAYLRNRETHAARTDGTWGGAYERATWIYQKREESAVNPALAVGAALAAWDLLGLDVLDREVGTPNGVRVEELPS